MGTIFSDVDGALIVLNPSTSEFIEFNYVAARIWELLEPGEIGIDSLVDALVQEFQVPRETCLQSVSDFLTRAEVGGLVFVT
jgi:hypothetical protein